MMQRNSGHIVMVGSVQGKISIPFRSACKLTFYTQVTKQGLNCQDTRDFNFYVLYQIGYGYRKFSNMGATP